MADVAGLVVGLLPLAWAAYDGVDAYLNGLKQRDTEIQAARVQLDIFRSWINFINDRIIAKCPLDEEEQSRIHRCSVIARKRVEELDHFVKSLKLDAAPDPDNSEPGWAKRHARELRYPLQRKRLKDLQEALRSVNTDLERALKPFEHHFHEQHHLRTDAGFARITELVENLTVQTTKIQSDLSTCNYVTPATIDSTPTSPDSGPPRPLTLDEMECLQTFRLTHGESDASYEWYKDRVDERVADTCLWFLNHENYKTWRQQRAGPLLVTADPGCGKSVLAKYLIDDELPRDATICYFFFKDQDQNKMNQALCAVLHQLFSARPDLLRHARAAKDRNGKDLVKVTAELRSVFEAVIRDPEASNTIFVFDALDECDPMDLQVLVDMMNNAFTEAPHDLAIKCLMTSRPYEQVSGEFFYLADKFPQIRIPGEQESDIIKSEVERVIHARIKILAAKKRLSAKLQEHLTLRLLEITHRTYLWAYLVFDYLEKSILRRTERGLDDVLRNLPTSIYDAYEKILSRSVDEDFVRRSLSFIAAAHRPLEVSELNVALQIDTDYTSSQDLDLEEDAEFELRLRECCGLFLTIDHGKVYFLHQTAREFLLIRSPRLEKSGFAVSLSNDNCQGSSCSLTPRKWQASISVGDAELVIAEACVRYLIPLESEVFYSRSIESVDDVEKLRQLSSENLDFLLYSVRHWQSHVHWAQESSMFQSIIEILNFKDGFSQAYWRLAMFERSHRRAPHRTPACSTAQYQLHLAAEMSHHRIAEFLLDCGASVDARPDDCINPPLRAAVMSWSVETVNLLLQRGADVNGIAPRTAMRRTALFPELGSQLKEIFSILLKSGADPNYRDQHGQTPLFFASDGPIAQTLLESGAEVDATDCHGTTALCHAVISESESCIEMLLKWGANPNIRTAEGWTPLFGTVQSAWWRGFEVILRFGGDINALGPDGKRTIWQYAAEKALDGPSRPKEAAPVPGHLLQLIQTKLYIDGRGSPGTTPLHVAVECGLRDTVEELLQAGARTDSQDEDQATPLIKAASSKHRNTDILKLLLSAGADPNAMSTTITPLLAAVYHEWDDGIRALLDSGADANVGTKWAGSLALHIAASFGLGSTLRILLEGGADADILDAQGRSALRIAEELGEQEVVEILKTTTASVKTN